MPLRDYFSPKQFMLTPNKSAAMATGNEGQKFVSQSYDPTINNLQSIGPAWWDYVAHTLDKAGKPRTDYAQMLQDMTGRYGTVTADTTAPDWFLKGQRYDYFNPQSPTAYLKAPLPTPAATPAGNNLASGVVTPQTTPTPPTPSGTPNTGTLGTNINQSPFSPTAGTRKRTSPNKYFNQNWFGTKQLA